MTCLLDLWIDRSEITNMFWIWSLDHGKQKSEFFTNVFSFLIKTAYFTQIRNFFIQVDILISCHSLSRVLHNSTQNHRKIRHFIKVYDKCYTICIFWFWYVFTKFTVFHSRYHLKQFQLINLVRLPHSFTPIPHFSYLSLFFIQLTIGSWVSFLYLSSIYLAICPKQECG